MTLNPRFLASVSINNPISEILTPPLILVIALYKTSLEAFTSAAWLLRSFPMTNEFPLSAQNPLSSAETSILIRSPSFKIR